MQNEIVLKSISEMRSKGESRRFLDDVGWLIEGLEGETPVACNRFMVLLEVTNVCADLIISAIEILQKMCDPEFVRRAKSVDFLGRIWGLMMSHRCSGSKVMEAALVFFTCQVAKENSALDDFAHQIESVLPLLCDMLTISLDNDILEQVSQSSTLKIKGYTRGEVLAVSLYL